LSLDARKLQLVVDRIVKGKNGNLWLLDHTYAAKFFNIIDPYITKASYKSDPYDPEDACAEVKLNIWRCLERYGARPNGFPFKATVQLKTNNILTNRANKRKSAKNKLNYMSESWDTLVNFHDNFIGGEPRVKFSRLPYHHPYTSDIFHCLLDRLLSTTRISKPDKEVMLSYLWDKICKMAPNQRRTVFFDLAGLLFDQSPKKVENTYKLMFNNMWALNKFLYNEDEMAKFIMENFTEDNMPKNDLNKVKPGDLFLTPLSKLIEIRSKTANGYKVLVRATGQEVNVNFEYIQNRATRCHPQPNDSLDKDPVEAVLNTQENKKAAEDTTIRVSEKDLKPDVVKDVPDQSTEVDYVDVPQDDTLEYVLDEDSPNVTEELTVFEDDPVAEVCDVVASPDVDDSCLDEVTSVSDEPAEKKSTKKTKKVKKQTAKSLVISLLKAGQKTRKDLAQAIIDEKLTSQTDINKVTQTVSVMLHNLKAKDGIEVERVSRGLYQIR